ncbi:reverse transcriptase [Phytophthora megakarya]|uniref:Reverse transcriptase n=1 Tax=Phytophthora megakarya TaxID=4795 RepID=A0A225VTV1_9STRA|nr:reverse transcriptase [Phytophthora megakarya]
MSAPISELAAPRRLSPLIRRAHARFEVLKSPGLFRHLRLRFKECTDCASVKGRPPNPGPSPWNIEPTGPFEVVSMDFVTHLPKSERQNTFLLLFQDMFTGYVMCKPMNSTTAQDCAEAYEEVVFRNYGRSRFMSRLFGRFSEMMGIQQKATVAHCPQVNGQQERSRQTESERMLKSPTKPTGTTMQRSFCML